MTDEQLKRGMRAVYFGMASVMMATGIIEANMVFVFIAGTLVTIASWVKAGTRRRERRAERTGEQDGRQ